MAQNNATKTVKGIKCIYNDKNIKIKKSHTIPYDEVDEFCAVLRERLPLEYKRSTKSWTKEIIAHNVLYNKNLFSIHTDDTDLEENEKWYRLLSYNVIYFFFKIVHR